MKHTNFYNEIDAYIQYEPSALFAAFIYLSLALLAVGIPLAVASSIFGAEAVTYWLADLVS